MLFAETLQQILLEGRIVLSQPIATGSAEEAEAAALLERAFGGYRLTIAGPPPAFDRESALEAARLVVDSAWLLVTHW